MWWGFKPIDISPCMMEKFLVRSRWKLFWYKNPDKNKDEMNNFGFKSTKYPSTDKDIKEFEDELMDMKGSVEMSSTPTPCTTS